MVSAAIVSAGLSVGQQPETKVFAEKATLYRAQGSQFTLRDETISETHSGSRIEVGRGASIIGTGSASVEQDENGNIRFSV